MPLVSDIQVQEVSINRLTPLVGAERTAKMEALASEARQALGSRRIININSTAAGGGVAEMMQVLLAYARGANIDARWLVITGNQDFFAITKRIHNGLHGSIGDGGSLGEAEHKAYDQVMENNAKELRDIIRPDDIVILHDPQTAGLVEHIKKIGAPVVWRSHIGSDHRDEVIDRTWEFLRPYAEGADAFVFTRAQYAPSWIDTNKTVIIQPSIDPFSTKNMDMTDEEVKAVLYAGGLATDGDDHPLPSFIRSDGSNGTVENKAEIVSVDGPVPVDARTIVQVSRWDHLKDMQGVMRGFANHLHGFDDVHLLLVGPSVAGVSDDPEGGQVLEECKTMWRELPLAIRRRVHLVTLPMIDRDENAVMVNAVQRHSTVMVQKSLAEGFGLTVTEAMWKARPIVASAIGGIPDQIVDGEHGLLLSDPNDLIKFGKELARLLSDETYAEGLAQNARARAIAEFLADRHLEQYAMLIRHLLGG